MADGREFKETGMPPSNQKIPLRRMFHPSDVTQARVEEILELEDTKAKVALAKLSCDLNDAKNAGQDAEGLLALLNIFYTPAITALSERLYARKYTGAEGSASLMVADGVLVLDES